LDSTPFDDVEFATYLASTARKANAHSAPDGHFDLLTVVLHELGHLLGITIGDPAFQRQVRTDVNGDASFEAGSMSIPLSSDRHHINAAYAPWDLMNAQLTTSMRKLPSALDASILQAVYGRVAADELAGSSVSVQGHDPSNQWPLAVSALASAPRSLATGITNGSFTRSDPTVSDFGWEVLGTLRVSNGSAVLSEDLNRLSSRLSQTFLVPAGAKTLRLTLSNINLKANALNPPDAFEIALFNSQTNQPLGSTITDLSGTDSLFNLQANGTARFAANVQVQGANLSGAVLSFANTVLMTIDLNAVPQDTAVTLYFDLIGFGLAESSVTIDDVQVVTGPPLGFALAPASDSGVTGDDVTNITPVTFVGTTNPRQQVMLDMDGDGFDDGSTTANDQGQFSFANVVLQEGAKIIRVQVTGAEGTTIGERTVTLDRLAPMVIRTVINGGEAQRSKVSSLAIQFSEDVSASMTAGALTLRNLTTNADVSSSALLLNYDRTANIALWTFPTLPGGSLADGNYTATLTVDRITDVAGNTLNVVPADPQNNGSFMFFRYFGDLDGDRDVDFYDFFAFQRTSGKKSTEAGFIAALDFYGDGAITGTDLEAYRAHHLTALPPPIVPAQGRISSIGSTAHTSAKANDNRGPAVVIARALLQKAP
jgi:hypothetical protein